MRLIDADEAMTKLADIAFRADSKEEMMQATFASSFIEVQPEVIANPPVFAKWESKPGCEVSLCSACGGEPLCPANSETPCYTHFCPWCGAIMTNADDDDDDPPLYNTD